MDKPLPRSATAAGHSQGSPPVRRLVRPLTRPSIGWLFAPAPPRPQPVFAASIAVTASSGRTPKGGASPWFRGGRPLRPLRYAGSSDGCASIPPSPSQPSCFAMASDTECATVA